MGLSMSDPERSCENSRNYCEFHHEKGHEIQECAEFRALVQGLMDNKEIEFCEGVKESVKEMLENVHINAIYEETTEGGTLPDIRPYEPGSVLNNWTAEEIPVDFEDGIDCGLSPNLLRMVKEEEKQILPHEETVKIVTLEKGKVVKIGTCITEEIKRDIVELLQEFKDIFAWSYQDMPRLSTDIVVHRLPIKEDCRPVQQKLWRMRPDIVLKIKEEVKRQFNAGFLQEVKYSEWVANIVSVPKKDGKVRMCVDCRDLNKASPKDNFPLSHIDTLVDNTKGYSLFSFTDGFSRYNQIKMHPEDMEKTTFITL
ncbi:RNA-directed DNA polymerase (Reverse transcriptase), Ribonuclease H [Gossypium australe]|uniref:RNA-directed DNA polymerase (Reverse transcriptase), Ribonuclease H n=1 Tax=Gossypium australe TaxID=47621 RepID=A0A5B6VKS4_9ROSI|nr:RNA-directed DNA polymerase (Reverse transcriptase), Ribonuclease H [Gossypium australe]